MSLVGLFQRPGPSGFGYNSTAEQVSEGLDLSGKRYLITGCNSGLGFETMRVLAMRGATVVGAARSTSKAEEATRAVQGDTVPLVADLADLDSLRAAVATVTSSMGPLDGLIANAGIMALPRCQQIHGIEEQFFTNHLGHFVLVTGLLDHLTEDARVVMLSSSAHTMAPAAGIEFDNLSGERGYAPWKQYGQSKLANLLFARSLARRFGSTGKVALAVHPGVIATNLGRHMNPLMNAAAALFSPLVLKTIPQGAATQTWAAVHPDAARHNGAYLADCNVAKSSAHGRDEALADRLWAESERLVAAIG